MTPSLEAKLAPTWLALLGVVFTLSGSGDWLGGVIVGVLIVAQVVIVCLDLRTACGDRRRGVRP